MADVRFQMADKVYKEMKKNISKRNKENIKKITIREYINCAVAEFNKEG